METSVAQSYLADILHVVSQGLLVPVIALLIALVGYALFCIGSVVAEYFTERHHFKVSMPRFLSGLMAANQDDIPGVIERSGLINRQKVALLTVYDYRMLPGDALLALIKRLMSEEETRYDRIRARNNMAARVSPMIGLMGTLIPLGPGIEALGRADTAALSSSLLVAFDTTVAGLIVAAVCLIIGKVRGRWYDDYLSSLDASMATLHEKIEDLRAAGEITTKTPTDYAFLFERSHGKHTDADVNAGTEKSESSDKGADKGADKGSEKNGSPAVAEATEPAGMAATAAPVEPVADATAAVPLPSITSETDIEPLPSIESFIKR